VNSGGSWSWRTVLEISAGIVVAGLALGLLSRMM
jgi:hypothetical protein